MAATKKQLALAKHLFLAQRLFEMLSVRMCGRKVPEWQTDEWLKTCRDIISMLEDTSVRWDRKTNAVDGEVIQGAAQQKVIAVRH
jgi:hypothetical protein